MNILQSVGNACHAAEQKDTFDVFGNYIATKMRRLSSSVDQETIEIIEHETANVTEENCRKFQARSSQAAAMYAYNPATSYVSQISPPSQLHSHAEQNIMVKQNTAGNKNNLNIKISFTVIFSTAFQKI